ncbi:MAG: DNA primase [Isosphaeraceae bacterium]
MPRHSEATLAAIKTATDIVDLVGEYLQVTRAGSKFKALCPFHDDHNPSLELNPDRQSYKCWSCGAGGDVFDFVMEYERVEFPEAKRMLAERAGIALDTPSTTGPSVSGATKSELLAVNAWAEGLYREALTGSPPALAYLEHRGLTQASVARFKLGYAPGERGWLLSRARKAGYPAELLERAGLATRPSETPGAALRQRFSGRLIFPIHDGRGRVLGFGGRVLPEVEQYLAASGKRVAKYLNSPETPVFHKRRVLYASDLARPAAREAGWVAVVEGYTDVIAAHQVGLCNVVGTLGTALGDDHVIALRRLADRVVLIFDGDAAGQNAADRALELFLGHEVDVRVLTLPENLDPCDFLLRDGADAFRSLVARAVDPLAFALRRAEARFDLASIEGSRLAADWVLAILARVPLGFRGGLDVKVAKALDTLAQKLRVPVETLDRRLRQIRQTTLRRTTRPAPNATPVPHATRLPAPAGPAPTAMVGASPAAADRAAATTAAGRVDPLLDAHPDSSSVPAPGAGVVAPLRLADLDPIDRELVQIVLNAPEVVGLLVKRVAVDALEDEPLRQILRACYDLHAEGVVPTFDRVALRIDDPPVRALAAGLLLPIDPAPAPDYLDRPPLEVRLKGTLVRLAAREHRERLRDVQLARQEALEAQDDAAYQALTAEYLRLMNQRPDTKTDSAS